MNGTPAKIPSPLASHPGSGKPRGTGVGRVRERGQALVEVALLLPLLALLTLGAVDLGRVYFAYTALTNAAREGAMCASLGALCPGGAAAAAAAEIHGALPGGITTTVSGGGGAGSSVTVTVRHSFQPMTTAVVASRTVPVTASATMMMQ